MQTENRFLDDLAKLATGAAGAVQGVQAEARQLFRQQLERVLAGMDLVSREEFEAVKAMAVAAREENTALKARLSELEAKIVTSAT